MKKLSVLSVLLVISIMLASCGSVSVEQAYRGEAPLNKSESFDMFYSSNDSFEETLKDGGAFEYGTSASGTVNGAEAEFKEEKLVYTSNVTLETEDFDAATESLHATIKSLGGIIVSENAYNLNSINSKGFRSLNMTVRIPQEHYDTFLSGMSETYNVANIQNSVQNLTEAYYDNENRLRSYRIQEERLFAMLEKAENVTEMLEIESRLCDVQYHIEALTNTQATIDNDVKYSTFYINLNEVTKYTTPAPKTFSDRLMETLKDSGEMFTEFLEGALFTVIILAPYIAILAVIGIVIVVAIKHRRKKLAAAKENNIER